MALTCKIHTDKYHWTCRNGIRVTGQVWMDDLYMAGELLADHFENNAGSFSDFRNLTSKLNGQFSVLIKKENEVWLKCSLTWSYPLFYCISAGQITVSDEAGVCLESLPERIFNEEVEPYFLNFGVTPVSETLIRNLNQTRPGETVKIDILTGTAANYVNPLNHEEGAHKSKEETAGEIRHLFNKYAGFLQNKKVLLPLTRGYDSRLLACLLKESGISQVVCATWGRVGGSERETAEKVAKKLGFRYIFIPYNPQTSEGFVDDKSFQSYISFSGHYSSMPYLQDFFAVEKLKLTGEIDEETVVLPGHPGDFIRGSHLYRSLPKQQPEDIISNIISLFGTSFPLSKYQLKQIHERIRTDFFQDSSTITNREKFQNWDFEERQCKLTGNSSQVYNYFNINYLMPLFDSNILSYFLSLPFNQRLGSVLYNQTLEELFFKPNGCDFDLKLPGKGAQEYCIGKEILIRHVPVLFKTWYYILNDDAYYREFTRELMKSDPENKYKNPVKPHFFNCFLVQWYVNRVKEGLLLP
jgi:asparagine synthase (glutamine-hydrolysing)